MRARTYKLRPQNEWVRVAVPDLQIIPTQLANDVAKELERRALPPRSKLAYANRQKHLLSGHITCGACGANFVVSGKDYYRCKSHSEGQRCTNRHSVRRARPETVVLGLMQSHLLTPELAATFAEEFNQELERQAKLAGAGQEAVSDRIAEIEEELRNLEQNLLAGHISDTLARLISERENEKRSLEAKRISS